MSSKTTKKELESLLTEKETQIESLKKENEELTDKWKRVIAELDNFRKRKEKEVENIRKFALEDILFEILQVLDNFQYALEHIEKTDSVQNLKEFKEGVRMIYQQFLDLLRKYNIERIETTGKEFDPNLHEAIEVRDEKSEKEGDKHIIVKEMLPGYTLYGKLLRPAKVVVSGNDSKK